MPKPIEAREAAQGNKMIEIRVRLWTNDLAGGEGKIRPKHAWSSGVVRMSSNPAHGIKPQNPRPFNSTSELSGVIERVLIEHGVKLHPSRLLQKLIAIE